MDIKFKVKSLFNFIYAFLNYSRVQIHITALQHMYPEFSFHAHHTTLTLIQIHILNSNPIDCTIISFLTFRGALRAFPLPSCTRRNAYIINTAIHWHYPCMYTSVCVCFFRALDTSLHSLLHTNDLLGNKAVCHGVM